MNAALIPSALAHRGYTWVFAAGYASFNVLGFYPGILYSDSVARWGMAIEIANHGLSVLSLHTNHHPVLAAIALSVFYRLTGELGVFVFCQSFAFALSLFVFVGVFRRGAIGNVLVSVVLMAPIVMSAMGEMGLAPQTAMMAVAMAASASFTSPISHPANILVMGPGGYRFADYIKLGVPLTLIVFVAVMLLLPIFWPITYTG